MTSVTVISLGQFEPLSGAHSTSVYHQSSAVFLFAVFIVFNKWQYSDSLADPHPNFFFFLSSCTMCLVGPAYFGKVTYAHTLYTSFFQGS